MTGTGLVEATRASECVVLAVPTDRCFWVAHALREHMAGKVLVSCANPFGGCTDQRETPQVAAWPSIAERVQRAAPEARVVAAFHHLAADRLGDLDDPLTDCDVLVSADDEEARDLVVELTRSILERPGIAAGSLKLARRIEAFTEVLIAIGRGTDGHPGLRINSGPPIRAGALALIN